MAHAAYPETMTADGNSVRSLTGRVKRSTRTVPCHRPLWPRWPSISSLPGSVPCRFLAHVPFTGRRAGGLVVAGIGLNVWALAERRRRSAGQFELERPEDLLDTGPYAITRHPMYVGWWLIRYLGLPRR